MSILTGSLKLDLLIGIITLIYYYLKRTYTYWERRDFASLPGVSFLFGHFKGTFLQCVQKAYFV